VTMVSTLPPRSPTVELICPSAILTTSRQA
jgi:hypothetical protein